MPVVQYSRHRLHGHTSEPVLIRVTSLDELGRGVVARSSNKSTGGIAGQTPTRGGYIQVYIYHQLALAQASVQTKPNTQPPTAPLLDLIPSSASELCL
jgi:hypothetical protein